MWSTTRWLGWKVNGSLAGVFREPARPWVGHEDFVAGLTAKETDGEPNRYARDSLTGTTDGVDADRASAVRGAGAFIRVGAISPEGAVV